MSDDGGYLAKILATTRFGKDTRPDSARQIRCGIVGEPVVAGKVEKATKPANALETTLQCNRRNRCPVVTLAFLFSVVGVFCS